MHGAACRIGGSPGRTGPHLAWGMGPVQKITRKRKEEEKARRAARGRLLILGLLFAALAFWGSCWVNNNNLLALPSKSPLIPRTPHHKRSACQSHVCMAFGLVTSPEAPCGATWPSRHPSCRSGACIHNWTSREPVFAAGKEDMLVQ
jgi:hypothetical protein